MLRAILTYFLLKIAGSLLWRVPVRVGYRLAALTGVLGYLLACKKRRVVTSNLLHVMGRGTDKGRLERAVWGVFQNAAKNYFDLVRLPRLDLSRFDHILTIHGWHHFAEALARRRGLILVTAHLGNFDLAAQVLAARSIPLTILIEPLRPYRLNRLVTSLRASQGLTFLPVGRASLRQMVGALRRGEIVALACDRDIQRNGTWLEFFGEEARLPMGAVSLAMRTGALILPAFSVRQGDDRVAIHLEPAFDPREEGEGEEQGMKRLISYIEKYVRRYPEQWVVFEPIWSG